MKIKEIMAKVLCMAVIMGNITIASASNVIINETSLEDEGIAAVNASSSNTDVAAETAWTTDEISLADVEVTYTQSSSYSVTIPKTVTLDSKKQAAYSVKVTGDIDTRQRVYVSPVDGISNTEKTDFYMKDQNGKKSDVVATVTQTKLYWDSEEVSSGYEETNNSISAPDLTSGTWKGTFEVEIKLQTEKPHEHNFIDGKCECGEIDPNHTHNYVDGACTICGNKEHTHNYVDGKCDCGEIDPNHKHDYVNGTCTICNQQLESGLYDANDNLLVSWENSGINNTCSNAKTDISNTYPKTVKVVIPDTVNSISQQAFQKCASLTDVIIPDSVTTIDKSAFSYCTSLENIVIPDSVTSIGNYAFVGCTSLENIEIGNSVISIGFQAFLNCESLAEIVIPNSVTTIEQQAFAGCTALTSAEVPSSVKNTNGLMFINCTSLEKAIVSIPSIDYRMFRGCTSLREVILSDDVTSIGAEAFYDCTALTDLVVPDSVTTITEGAFYNVPHITYHGTATGSPWSAKSMN